MTYYTQTRTDSAIERLLHSTALVFQDAAATYARHRVYRTTMKELGALSDRELADIGMHRSGIRGVAKEAAEKTRAR